MFRYIPPAVENFFEKQAGVLLLVGVATAVLMLIRALYRVRS